MLEFRLRLLKYASPQRTMSVDALHAECDAIVAIITAGLKTKKAYVAEKQRLARERPPG